MFLGVADGVGSWSDRGIDPSIFSQALMYYAHEHCQNGKAGEPTSGTSQEKDMTPLECMQLAYDDVLADDFVEAGKMLCISNENPLIFSMKAPVQHALLV